MYVKHTNIRDFLGFGFMHTKLWVKIQRDCSVCQEASYTNCILSLNFPGPLQNCSPGLCFKILILAFSKELYKNSLMESVCCRDAVDAMLANMRHFLGLTSRKYFVSPKNWSDFSLLIMRTMQIILLPFFLGLPGSSWWNVQLIVCSVGNVVNLSMFCSLYLL